MASMLLRRSGFAAAALICASILPVSAQARDAVPTSDSVAMMNAGEFLWHDSSGAQPTAAAVRIVVSIADQKLYVYRGANLVAVSAVSTGKPGHDTPTGEFTILQKQVMHRSNLYDDAPMPYMQRVTWDGVAIHAGRDPGYAASHGCVRVPLAFAKRLYGITRLGAHVTITDDPVLDAAPPQADTTPPEATPPEATEPAAPPETLAAQPETTSVGTQIAYAPPRQP